MKERNKKQTIKGIDNSGITSDGEDRGTKDILCRSTFIINIINVCNAHSSQSGSDLTYRLSSKYHFVIIVFFLFLSLLFMIRFEEGIQ